MLYIFFLGTNTKSEYQLWTDARRFLDLVTCGQRGEGGGRKDGHGAADTVNSLVVTRGQEGGDGRGGRGRVEYLVMEGELALGDEHTMQHVGLDTGDLCDFC